MKIELRVAFQFLAVTLLVLVATSLSAAQSSDPCAEVNLPVQVIELLKVNFPDWRPKSTLDLENDDRQLWLKAHAKECPGAVIGQFERTDRPAFAVLLVPKSDSNGGYRLLVFSKGSSGNTYRWKVLDHADGKTYSGLVISKALPGKYSDFASRTSIQTTLDGIYLEWIEKGADLFYWSAGRYHKLQVSE